MVILIINLWTFRLPSYKTLCSVKARQWQVEAICFVLGCSWCRRRHVPFTTCPRLPQLHQSPQPLHHVSYCMLLLQCSSSSYQFSEAGSCLQHPVIEPSRPRPAGPLLHVSKGGALCRLGYVHGGNQVFSLQCQHGGDQSTVPSAPLLLHSTYGSN